MVRTATLPWLTTDFFDGRYMGRPYTGHDLKRAYPTPVEPLVTPPPNPVLAYTREIERIRKERNKANGESVVAGTRGDFPCHGGLSAGRISHYIPPPAVRRPTPEAAVRESCSVSSMTPRRKTWLREVRLRSPPLPKAEAVAHSHQFMATDRGGVVTMCHRVRYVD